MITVADLIAYRRRHDKLIERVVETQLPTQFGDFRVVGFRSLVDDKHHVAMVKGEIDGEDDVLVRVHSECLTGDVFHSLRCDCGQQLEDALARIEEEGRGVLLYLAQEGRGHRPAQQAARLPPPGGGPRHRRRQPRAGPARRPARLRHRCADPRGPRARLDPPAHQQPEEDRGSRGLRPARDRPGADPARRRASTTRAYLRTKKEKLGHLLHHQGLALDEEMIHEERVTDREKARRPSRPTSTARARRRRAGAGWADRYAACVGRFYAELAETPRGRRAAGVRRRPAPGGGPRRARRLRAAAGR